MGGEVVKENVEEEKPQEACLKPWGKFSAGSTELASNPSSEAS